MRFNLLSTLLLTAVLAAGVVGCKKKMDRVTPLPGYGGSGKIGDAPPDRLTPGIPGGDANALANNPNGIPQTGAVSLLRNDALTQRSFESAGSRQSFQK